MIRDNQDGRGWCRACYVLESVQEHDGCCCVCHPTSKQLANETRSRGYALVFAQEIERSGRVTRKILTR